MKIVKRENIDIVVTDASKNVAFSENSTSSACVSEIISSEDENEESPSIRILIKSFFNVNYYFKDYNFVEIKILF